MDEKERARRVCDFLSTLPLDVQKRIEQQKRLEAENKADAPRIFPERFNFSRWYY